jgi:hypothetical protein
MSVLVKLIILLTGMGVMIAACDSSDTRQGDSPDPTIINNGERRAYLVRIWMHMKW